MSDSSNPSPETTAASRTATFVLRWAEFTKAWSIYPSTNARVTDARDRVVAALPEAIAEVGEVDDLGLRVIFASGRYTVAGRDHELRPGSIEDWLSERIHRAALAGIEFQPDLDAEALSAFTEQLLEHFKRRQLDAPFETLWPDPFAGLRLVDRRFEGFFDDSTVADEAKQVGTAREGGVRNMRASREVARLVAENGEIQETVGRLRMHLTTDGSASVDTQSLDVLSKIIDSLPHDTLTDYGQAVDTVQQVLDRLEAEVARADGDGGRHVFSGSSVFNQVVQATSQGILGSQAPTDAQVAEKLRQERESGEDRPYGSRSGRKGDDAITDDVGELCDDMAALPPPYQGEFTPESVECLDEQLGVLLHFLTELDGVQENESLRAHIVKLLAEPGTRRLSTLYQFLETSKGTAFDRLVTFLRANGLARLLRSCGFLTDTFVLESFPEHFGLFLDSLDPDRPADTQRLGPLLKTLGSRRIREHADALVQEEGVLEEHRVLRLLREAVPALLPLLRLILEQGDDAQRAQAVHRLVQLRLDLPEACLLYVWDDPVGLPLPYLRVIADPDRTREQLVALHGVISQQICRWLRAAEACPDREERRTYAIQHLGAYPSTEAERLLEEVLGSRRFGLVPRESKGIRDAARGALDAIRRFRDAS